MKGNEFITALKVCYICNKDVKNKDHSGVGKYCICARCNSGFKKWKDSEACLLEYKKFQSIQEGK